MLGTASAESFRIALFHTELDRDGPGLLLRDILKGEDDQITAVISVLRAANADVLILGGIDYDLQNHALNALADRIGGYPNRFSRMPNRGIATGADLDRDGRLGEPEDTQGYAEFAGQGGLAILSRLQIHEEGMQDFTNLLWHDLPDTLAGPDIDPSQRLSTTAHWIVPVGPVSLLIWHATPSVFDGPEDRNGRRNHDEAAIWLSLLSGDIGQRPTTPVVLAGISNLDTIDGEGKPEAMQALLAHPALNDVMPKSQGAVFAAASDGGINATHKGDPALDTVDWPDETNRPGNLRVDYILPERSLKVLGAGVLWPEPETSLSSDVIRASRHRLVWIDIDVQP